MNGIAFIAIGGNLINEAIVSRVEVLQRLNAHWFCEIECRDTLDHPIPGADALGAPCVMTNVAEDGSEYTIFSGVVIDVALKREVWGSYSAVLRAASPSWMMDHAERNAYYATGLLSDVAGQLGASCLCKAVPTQNQYVQFGETNWQFLLRLADDAGAWVRAGLGSIDLTQTFDTAQPLVFRGINGLLEFFIEGELGPAKMAAAQYDSAKMQSQTWAGEQQAPQFEAAGQRMGASVQSGSAAQALLGYTERSRSWTADDMATRARFEAERAQGTGVVAGGTSRQQTLCAGGSIEVQNCRDADGTYHLIEVTHVWTSTGYVNHFLATSWAGWHGRTRPRPTVAPGVQAARVVANHDPVGRGRLLVSLYWQENGALTWAPLASLHCGAEFGITALPEVGDEVLVSFTDGDPERPVILGSLWNGVQQPPREQFATADESENNLVKRLVTKSGVRIHIVDTPGIESLSLATPRSNNFQLSEKVAETGRPALSFNTLGDIHINAAGRIHRQSALNSHHFDGKIEKSAMVSVADIYGNTKPFETLEIHATLSDGSAYQGPVASGQGFHKLPPGTNSFTAPDFHVPKPTAEGGDDA